MSESKCALILLGAGGSARMHGPKQLLPWKNESNLLEHACQTCLASQAVWNIFVLGANIENILQVSPWLKDGVSQTTCKIDCIEKNKRFSLAVNKNWVSGMASSLKVGLEKLINLFPQEDTLDSLAVCLADLPLLKAETINNIIKAGDNLSRKERRHTIIVPTWQGKRGHPVIFGRDFWPELRLLNGDRGGGTVLKKYPQRCLFYETTGPEIFTDCDTWSAYVDCCRQENLYISSSENAGNDKIQGSFNWYSRGR